MVDSKLILFSTYIVQQESSRMLVIDTQTLPRHTLKPPRHRASDAKVNIAAALNNRGSSHSLAPGGSGTILTRTQQRGRNNPAGRYPNQDRHTRRSSSTNACTTASGRRQKRVLFGVVEVLLQTHPLRRQELPGKALWSGFSTWRSSVLNLGNTTRRQQLTQLKR